MARDLRAAQSLRPVQRGLCPRYGEIAGLEALEPRLLLSGGAGEPVPLDNPAPVTITSTKAAWVSQVDPSTNFGSQATMLIGAENISLDEKYSYVAFDLSGLPAGAAITGATLRMKCTSIDAIVANDPHVFVDVPASSWNEDLVNWGNRPTTFLKIGGSSSQVVTIVTEPGWVAWDVTAAVTRWQSGAWTNNGFAIAGGSGPADLDEMIFASDDDPTPANRPQLVVDYATDPPVITSFDLAGGIGLTGSRTVTLDAAFDNSPTEYLASEYADFRDATWQALPPTDAPTFTLSQGNGLHTVYLKVRNAIGECDESAWASINLQETYPDLYISRLGVASDRPPAGGTVSVTVRVSNADWGASAPCTTTIYWSADATIDTGDQAMLAVPTPVIGPDNDYYEVTVDVPVPAVVRAGDTYYIGAIADTFNTSGERDHTNSASDGLAVRPLGVWIDTESIWASDERPRGEEWVTVNVPVRNDGGATDTVVRLSLFDSSFTWISETLLDGRLVYDSSAAGQDQTLHFWGSGTLDATFALMVPADAAAGQYVVVASASDQPASQPGAFVFDTTGPAESAADWTAAAFVGTFTADAGGYRAFDEWGGEWQDAEKDAEPSGGELMCWAGAASNVLAWTRWGLVGGLTMADGIFAYFQDHWSDLGGDPSVAWRYWFDGTNSEQGNASFSQIDAVPGGGGFYSALNVDDYLLQQNYGPQHPLSSVMADAYSYLTQGAGVAISVDYDGSHGHSITLWGVNTYSGEGPASDPADPAHYTGIWVSDSDDDKTAPDGATARDRLRYYPLTWSPGDGRYNIDGYSDLHTYYINGAVGLKSTEIDLTPPTVAIAPVTPNPRNEAVANIGIAFDEPVVGFGLEDLALTRDGAAVAWGGASLSSADGGKNWTLWGLSGPLGPTGVPGSYTLTLTAEGSGIADLAGNPLAEGAATTWSANHAPILDVGMPPWLSLTAINEDAADADNPGTLVSDILANLGRDSIADDDAAALEGIAVVALVVVGTGQGGDEGSWQYNVGGAGWVDFGSPSAAAARLLGAADRIRYVPPADYDGSPARAPQFRAWDRTAGTPGGTADLTGAAAVGGLTAFSTGLASVRITVNPTNDEPVGLDQDFQTDLNTSFVLYVNFSDDETTRDGMTYHVPARSAHGTLTEVEPGGYRYKPDLGFAGTDTFQFTVTDDGAPAGTHAGGGDLTSDPATVTIEVGWEMPLDAHGVATFYDPHNVLVKVALTGGGTGRLQFPHDPYSGNPAYLGMVVLENTTLRSALTITTTGAGSLTGFGGVLVAKGSSLGSITGKTTSLAGVILVPGLLGSVTLDDVYPGSVIIANDSKLASGTTQLTLTFDRVSDTMVGSYSEPIKSITATEWVNTPGSDVEWITAPSIGKITTLGRKANARAVPPVAALAGDFSANLALPGVADPDRTPALGTVKIAGAARGGTWYVQGDVGSVTAVGTAEGWTLQGPEADGAGLHNVKTLNLGDVHDATVLADGAIGTVKALNWDGGAIAADSLGSLSITGRRATGSAAWLPGDFRNADVTLRANATPAVGKASIAALGSAGIAGSLVDSTWSVDMDAGAIAASGGAGGWTLAGAGDGDQTDLLSVKSLTLGDVADASVTVRPAQLKVTNAKGQQSDVTAGGVLGAVKALRWAAGAIEADSLASMTITGRKLSATLSEVLGDFGAAVTLGGQNLPARKPAAGAVSIAHDLAASVWQVTGSMATLTVTHTALNSTVRASGSIASISLGAGDGSRFLAGVTNDQQLDPAAAIAADLEDTASATIGSVTIKGWAVPGGQAAAPDFLTATSFLAPCLGTVSLLNADLDTCGLYALADAMGLRIKSVSHKDTRPPKVPALNWTWTPARNAPDHAGGTAKDILP